VQLWVTWENPRLGAGRVLTGVRGGLWMLDGMAKGELRKTVDHSPFTYARGPRVYHTVALTGMVPYSRVWIDPGRYSRELRVVDLSVEYGRQRAGAELGALRALLDAGYAAADARRPGRVDHGFFYRGELEGKVSAARGVGGRLVSAVRGFVGRTPVQRAIGLSARDATDAFDNHLLRPEGAPLARPEVHYVDLGGAGLRGYSPLLRLDKVAAVNGELAYALREPNPAVRRPQLWLTAFVDAAAADRRAVGGPTGRLLADAGLGLALRGPLFDRAVRARLDFPLYVRHPLYAPDEGDPGAKRVEFRWTFSFRDLW
jgi:hypothetical protein